jgi:mannose-6-phosphate isomerase-like protein (cupin superfamily)
LRGQAPDEERRAPGSPAAGRARGGVSCIPGLALRGRHPPALSVRPVVEKKLKELPPGLLFWRIETFPTLSQAQAAAEPTALAAEVSGKVWLFTLGPKGGATAGAVKVAEIGPVPPVQAPEYLLRINHASGPPGARTPPHSHPGSEAFYVLKGRLGQRTPHGIVHADAGAAMNGHGADMQCHAAVLITSAARVTNGSI